MMSMPSPLNWIGGKRQLAPKIISYFPKFTTYCEPFFGAGWVFFTKQPSKVEFINDLNGKLIAFWKTLQNKEALEEFKRRLTDHPMSEQLYYEYRVKKEFKDEVDKAITFYYLLKLSFGGRQVGSGQENFGYEILKESKLVSFYNTNWDRLWRRLQRVIIWNKDAMDVIKLADRPETLFYCLTPDTKIRMLNETQKLISEIEVGDEIFYGQKVINIMKRKIDEKINCINVTGIKEDLKITDEHPILALRKEDFRDGIEPEYIKAKDLYKGDYICIPTEGEIQCNSHDLENLKSDFFRLLGYYLAEAHIQYMNIKEGKVPCGVIFSFGTHEKHIIEDCKNLVDKYSYSDTKAIVKVGPVNSVTQVRIFNTNFAKWMKELGGSLAGSKCLRSDILLLPKEYQLELLRGWIIGDGSFWSDINRRRYKLLGVTKSDKLAEQMYTIMLRLNLRPSWKIRISKLKDKKFRVNDVYLSSSRDINKLYIDRFKCIEGRDLTTRKIKCGYIFSPIRKIERINYNGEVFNLETEEKRYIANYIEVHNCDPPYVVATDKGGYYAEADEGLHYRLLNALREIKGKFVLSYDDLPEVRNMYGDWCEIRKEECTYTSANTRSAIEGRKTKTELVIMNFKPPTETKLSKWMKK